VAKFIQFIKAWLVYAANYKRPETFASKRVVTVPTITRTLTDDEMKKVFGDFNEYLNIDGNINATWERKILTYIPLPKSLPLAWNKSVRVHRISCHFLIADFLQKALEEISKHQSVWDTINDYGGVYSFRMQRESGSVSRHSWATAIDLDVGDNPFKAIPNVHPRIVEIFLKNGFLWGGSDIFPEGRKDGMHFEFADLSKIGDTNGGHKRK